MRRGALWLQELHADSRIHVAPAQSRSLAQVSVPMDAIGLRALLSPAAATATSRLHARRPLRQPETRRGGLHVPAASGRVGSGDAGRDVAHRRRVSTRSRTLICRRAERLAFEPLRRQAEGYDGDVIKQFFASGQSRPARVIFEAVHMSPHDRGGLPNLASLGYRCVHHATDVASGRCQGRKRLLQEVWHLLNSSEAVKAPRRNV